MTWDDALRRLLGGPYSGKGGPKLLAADVGVHVNTVLHWRYAVDGKPGGYSPSASVAARLIGLYYSQTARNLDRDTVELVRDELRELLERINDIAAVMECLVPTTDEPPDTLLTIPEAARRTGAAINKLRRAIDAGEIPVRGNRGNRKLIVAADVYAVLYKSREA
jgi:hypothetical protein